MSQNLKFLHFNNDQANRKLSRKQARLNQSRTFAAAALSADEIRAAASAFSSCLTEGQLYLKMAVGVVKVSLDDNYNRELGRILSTNSLQEINLEIIGITINQKHVFLNFAEYEGVNLSARLNRETGFSTIIGKMKESSSKVK